MFTEYHVIQFILHGLIAKLKYFGHKNACEVNFGTEQYQSKNCL